MAHPVQYDLRDRLLTHGIVARFENFRCGQTIDGAGHIRFRAGKEEGQGGRIGVAGKGDGGVEGHGLIPCQGIDLDWFDRGRGCRRPLAARRMGDRDARRGVGRLPVAFPSGHRLGQAHEQQGPDDPGQEGGKIGSFHADDGPAPDRSSARFATFPNISHVMLNMVQHP